MSCPLVDEVLSLLDRAWSCSLTFRRAFPSREKLMLAKTILKLLLEVDDWLTVQEIVEKVHMSRSAVHKLLLSLFALGLVERRIVLKKCSDNKTRYAYVYWTELERVCSAVARILREEAEKLASLARRAEELVEKSVQVSLHVLHG
jgi:predicted transcriptional regulator